MFSSEYYYWPYVIAQVSLLGTAAFFILLGSLFVLHAYCSGKLGLLHIRFFGIVALFLSGLITLDLAVVQGMEQVPTAATAVICVVTWAVLTPFAFVFLGGNAEQVLWLKSRSSGSAARRRRAESHFVPSSSSSSFSSSCCVVAGDDDGSSNNNNNNDSDSSMVDARGGAKGVAAAASVTPFFPAVSMVNFRVDPVAAASSTPSGIDGVKGPGVTRGKGSSPKAGSTDYHRHYHTGSPTASLAILKAKEEVEEEKRRQQQQQQQQDPHPPADSTPCISVCGSAAGMDGVAAAVVLSPPAAVGRMDLRHSGADAIQLLTEMSQPVDFGDNQARGDQRRATFVQMMTGVAPDDASKSNNNNNNNHHKNNDDGVIMGFLRLFLDDVKRHPILFTVYVVFGVACITVSHLVLYGLCVMNKPTSIDTWLLRRSQKQFCPAGEKPCFVYPLLGDSCSTIVIASHLRLLPGSTDIPNAVTATVCDEGENNVSLQCSTVTGVLRNNDNIEEDRRYIANVYVQGLRCGGRHTVVVNFSMTAKSFVSDKMCFRALPGRATHPDLLSNRVEELSFIEGGDYVVKGKSSKPSKGQTLLRQAMLDAPDAAFFALGGDVAYDNNVRRCYCRVDEMLSEVIDALTRPQDGCIVPLFAGIGNHDSGGTDLWQGQEQLSTVSGRERASSFFLQYFPTLSFQDSTSQEGGRSLQRPNGTTSPISGGIQAAPADLIGDYTSTFSVRLIGSNSSLVFADSGHWSPIPTQAQYLRDALARLRSLKKTAMVGYHVPAFPSTRNRDNEGVSLGSSAGHSQTVFENFGPVLADYDDVITIVFEHHDHNYKRTSRVHVMNSSVVAAASSSSSGLDETDTYLGSLSLDVMERRRGRGVVFNGDGALGASDNSPLTIDTPPLRVGKSGNYVTVARLFVNGSLSVKAVGTTGELIDRFLVV